MKSNWISKNLLHRITETGVDKANGEWNKPASSVYHIIRKALDDYYIPDIDKIYNYEWWVEQYGENALKEYCYDLEFQVRTIYDQPNNPDILGLNMYGWELIEIIKERR
ncbi:hypothetical protein SCHIN_v1c08400 [Spiroplasma chinense]|uniref:Uncharacterized protein n=1 Tax=Spiroplasma chinense TaxID=216932 RepID=A0A5B9Y5D7_9MOLU|nr:hypothetical protein [Spiroplasma chinense]QEH62035.1 hypothetical protein SCHIN_v1c08400 [Spiroplasma chinense]